MSLIWESIFDEKYKVKVERVRVLNVPSKNKRIGRFEGVKSGFKKAMVTLKEGSKIDLAS